MKFCLFIDYNKQGLDKSGLHQPQECQRAPKFFGLSHVCAVPHLRLAARRHVRLNVSAGAALYRTCTQVVRRFTRMVNQDGVLSLTEDLSWRI